METGVFKRTHTAKFGGYTHPNPLVASHYLRGFTYLGSQYDGVKKTELVHLHALLVLLSERVVDRGIVDRSYFEPYAELDVTPVSFRARRDHHEEAVLLLASLLAAAVSDEYDPPADVESVRTESDTSTSSRTS